MRPDVKYNLFWNTTSTHIMWLRSLPYCIPFIVPSLCGFFCIHELIYFFLLHIRNGSTKREFVWSGGGGGRDYKMAKFRHKYCLGMSFHCQSILAGQEIEYIIRIQLHDSILITDSVLCFASSQSYTVLATHTQSILHLRKLFMLLKVYLSTVYP